VIIICGTGAITILFQNLVVAYVVGITGIAAGIATLGIGVEKLDKFLAMTEIILSVIPIFYAAVILVRK
jgi:hypothetical protein